MKYFLTILYLFTYSLFCHGQIKCDSGYSYMPTISSSSLKIEADTCLPDSTCKKLWREFRQNVCEETSHASIGLGGNGSLWYSENHKWDDLKGCIVTEEFKVMRKNKWVKISKKEFYRLNKK